MKENSINKKEVDNGIKINIPIISNQEIENTINTENLYDKIAKHIYHDREMIILQEFIKKLQKENEELKQDRNNNYQMIALAQNEALGYMQGYEDGKKLKRSAVANIVENQQYYIFNKQIEHYKEYIVKLQKENEKALAEYMKWQKQELGQKDKIIDLMANHIATSDSDLCEYLDITTKCKYYAGDNGKTCDNCIKQYFENKAKEIK